MDESRWGCWLHEVTGEDTERGIARATERSHTTVQRWIKKGVPPDVAWELTIRFRSDPVKTLLVLGRITHEQVSELNYAAILTYAPEEFITSELHRRAVERQGVARSPLVPLGRSDNLTRLTGK